MLQIPAQQEETVVGGNVRGNVSREPSATAGAKVHEYGLPRPARDPTQPAVHSSPQHHRENCRNPRPACWPAEPKPSYAPAKHGHKLLNGGTKHRISIH